MRDRKVVLIVLSSALIVAILSNSPEGMPSHPTIFTGETQ